MCLCRWAFQAGNLEEISQLLAELEQLVISVEVLTVGNINDRQIISLWSLS